MAAPNERSEAVQRIKDAQQEMPPNGSWVRYHIAYELAVELDALRSATAPQAPSLDKPAQIGATRFGVGVKWSTVIDRAQREWDYFHGLENTSSRRADAGSSNTAQSATPAMPTDAEILLAAGEMSAQELRTVKAVLAWFIRRATDNGAKREER